MGDKQNIYAPVIKEGAHEIDIILPLLPREQYTCFTVFVEHDGFIASIEGSWQGKPLNNNTANIKEVFNYLQEWELAILMNYDVEGMEWAATTKLDPAFGHTLK